MFKMNRESNSYTLIFATGMVIVVALILSLAHESLKETQNKNVEIDKISQILRSIRIETTDKDALGKYEELISDVFLVDEQGNKIEGSKDVAFATDLKAEMYKPKDERQYPVFVASIDGDTKYIMALSGKGLWGDIWGYMSVNSDGNTIYGADFSHSGETPGLGAEIATAAFSDQFMGKHIFRDEEFKSIAVVKSGKLATDRDYVDGISGGTITGNGIVI